MAGADQSADTRLIMTDPLLLRAQLAIEDSRSISEQRHLLSDRREDALNELRLNIFQSASARAEIKAYRDNRGYEEGRKTDRGADGTDVVSEVSD